LDINSNIKGVLFPNIEKTQIETVPNIPDGMFYYETSTHKFRYKNIDKWEPVNPMTVVNDSTVEINNINAKVSLKTPEITPPSGGKLSIEATTVNASTSLTTPKIVATSGTLTIEAPTVTASTITATTVNAVNGNGTVPIGGIIMWAGTTPPKGWAFCDGTIYGTLRTPDLRGRFIAGYTNFSDGYTPDPRYPDNSNLEAEDNEYNTIGKPNGTRRVALSASNLPNHTHTGSTTTTGSHSHTLNMKSEGYRHAASGITYTPIGEIGPTVSPVERYGKSNTDGGHNHSVTVSTCATCTRAAFDNRPPYYILAFIIRYQ
jgi:microcystin-dependent protein